MNCTHDVLLSMHMRIFNLQPLEIIEATSISVVNKSPIKVVHGYVPGYKHNGCRSEKNVCTDRRTSETVGKDQRMHVYR